MKNLSFEVHKYAPELNKVYVRGVRLCLPFLPTDLTSDYADNVRYIRVELKKYNGSRRYWIIDKLYPREFESLNRSISGLADFAELRMILRGEKNKIHSEPVRLLDGRMLPVPIVSARIKKRNCKFFN